MLVHLCIKSQIFKEKSSNFCQLHPTEQHSCLEIHLLWCHKGFCPLLDIWKLAKLPAAHCKQRAKHVSWTERSPSPLIHLHIGTFSVAANTLCLSVFYYSEWGFFWVLYAKNYLKRKFLLCAHNDNKQSCLVLSACTYTICCFWVVFFSWWKGEFKSYNRYNTGLMTPLNSLNP